MVEKTLDWLELLGPCSKFSEGNMIDWALVKYSPVVQLMSQNVQMNQYATGITASMFFFVFVFFNLLFYHAWVTPSTLFPLKRIFKILSPLQNHTTAFNLVKQCN